MKLATNPSNRKNTYIFIISLLLVAVTMFIFIGQKDGFHEDEIHSYGSSNYKYDDVFYASADRDATNRVIAEHIVGDSFSDSVSKYLYYREHPEEFEPLIDAEIAAETPVWKTAQEAKDYLAVSQGEQFNFISPYYNQIDNVNPPLFYLLVHFVSSIFVGTFSKYIIFSINILFILGACILMRKILKLFDKDHLAAPAVLLYGLSMGAISTVIFFRMYAMFTFFTVAYFYLTVKITKSDFTISKKTAALLIITAVLGFLTQYYIYLFIIPVFIIMVIRMLNLKKYRNAVFYTIYHIVSVAIGFIFFPPAFEHLFPEKAADAAAIPFFDQLEVLINRLLYAFSINRFVGVAIFLATLSYVFIKLISKTENAETKSIGVFNILLFVVPVISFVLLTSKLVSLNLNINTMVRYVAPVLPVMAICFVVFADKVVKLLAPFGDKGKSVCIYALVFVISLCGFVVSEPSYLYRGYDKYIEVAQNHKDLNYVYVYDNYYTHLTSLPEMTIYNKTLIINFYDEKQVNVLSGNEELEKSNQFVLSIKKWMINDENPDEILNKVLELTGYTKSEILLNQEDDTESILYLISK